MKNTPAKEPLSNALRSYYAPGTTGRTTVRSELLTALQQLPAWGLDPQNDTTMSLLHSGHPSINLGAREQAIIMFVDEALTRVLKAFDADFKVEAMVRNLAPLIAMDALVSNTASLQQPRKIYELIDELLQSCIGWNEDLGVLGAKYIDKTETALLPLIRGVTSPAKSFIQLKRLLQSEQQRHRSLEQNLINQERQRLDTYNARCAGAKILNREMTGQQFSLFVIFALQGAWFEWLQKIYNAYGKDSKEWQTVQKLTQLLISSLEAHQSKQIPNKLLNKIEAFASSLEFDCEFMQPCIEDIRAEFSAIAEGSPSAPCEFNLLALDSTPTSAVDPVLLQTIMQTTTGGWYIVSDSNEPEEKTARIKLIVNHASSERLVFTNQNRRKVLTMTYAEFATKLTAASIKPIRANISVQSAMKQQLQFVIATLKEQKARIAAEKQAEKRKKLSQQFISEQRNRASDFNRKLSRRAAQKKHLAQTLRQKAEQKYRAARKAVNGLRPGAWVKLPIMEGTQTACKLAAIVTAADKYIFTNRAGIRVADYSSSQLSNLIVTENSEILDTGHEFESVLASVVTDLRHNKGKSFDQLSGHG